VGWTGAAFACRRSAAVRASARAPATGARTDAKKSNALRQARHMTARRTRNPHGRRDGAFCLRDRAPSKGSCMAISGKSPIGPHLPACSDDTIRHRLKGLACAFIRQSMPGRLLSRRRSCRGWAAPVKRNPSFSGPRSCSAGSRAGVTSGQRARRSHCGEKRSQAERRLRRQQPPKMAARGLTLSRKPRPL
jgi:hypothetical protein